MPFNLDQDTDGSAAFVNSRGGRKTLDLRANDAYAFAGPPIPTMFDDFLGDVIADQWHVDKGSDGSAVNFAALTAVVGGQLQATTGAGAGASMAANGVQLDSFLQWKANAGGLVMEARVKIEAITTCALFIGFTDQVSALEAPITSASSANTITTNATDAVGFMFDTEMTADTLWLVGVANGTDATSQNTALAPTADTFHTYRIEVNSAGGAKFFFDGVQCGTVTGLAGAVTATVALSPVVTFFRRAATATACTVDYILVQSERV